jgi:hypothetical protein
MVSLQLARGASEIDRCMLSTGSELTYEGWLVSFKGEPGSEEAGD